MDGAAHILQQLKSGGIIAMLPGDIPLATSLAVADALLAAPVLAAEMALDGAASQSLLSDLRIRAGGNMLVGVRGIEDGGTLQTAVAAGAQFLSSPRFELDMMLACREQHVVYLPGVISIMAAQLAANAGCDLIRLRTGGQDGPNFVRRLRHTFPQLGVLVEVVDDQQALAQTKAYAAAGATAMLAGPSLFADAAQPMAEIIANARDFRTAWEAGRQSQTVPPVNGRLH